VHELQRLSAVVQKNCHISDARYARDYSICTYLLKMREYYRWEKRVPFASRLPKEALGHWLDERERLWSHLEAQPFECLPVADDCYDPFHTDAVNQTLLPRGLIYSGGYGAHARPHFFLGKLLRAEERGDFTVLISSDEYARDLTAPPALMQGKTIFVRRESFRRMLWEKYEEWNWRRQDGPMAQAVACYGFKEGLNGDVDRMLDQMIDPEIEAAIQHELGEGMAGKLLDPEWQDMLMALARSRAELMARAVRDHLADCLCTLPALAEGSSPASIHFYFANLKGMRREIFPSLALAYARWLEHRSEAVFVDLALKGSTHWTQVAREMLDLYQEHREQSPGSIEALVESSYL
jgi:hypothetical protein